MDKSIRLASLSWIFLAPLLVQAHHNTTALYDRNSIVELDGEVTAVFWRNPHVYIELSVTGPDGEPVLRSLETQSVATLTRAGIGANSINVGDRIRVAGFPSRTTEEGVFVSNILIPNGDELVMVGGVKPRWATEQRGDYSYGAITEGDSSRPDLGIFRVWSSGLTNRNLRRVDLDRLPLTEAARTAFEQFDPAEGLPIDYCTPKGMPSIMGQPFPMEFVQDGADILLRIEEYDLVRQIHMNQEAIPAETPLTSLGYSIGRWDDSALVVTTSRLSWQYFDQLGVPQSSESVIVERFTLVEDGSRLNYDRTITDPVNFTEPVIQQAYWIYNPDEEIKPYDCTAQSQVAITGTEFMRGLGANFDAPVIRTEVISPGLHVLRGIGGNVAVSVGDQGVLVVDDQFPVMIPKIQEAISELGGGNVDFVINTHWHFDHTDGNPLLARSGSWIVSQVNARTMMTDGQLINVVSALVEQPASPPEGLPVITYDDRMRFHFNNEEIDLLHFGPAHTTGDTAVVFRGHNAVHMGDVYSSGGYPFIDFDNGGTFDGLILFCEAVLQQIDEDTVVIPGHGGLADYAGLADYVTMLRTIRERLAILIASGATLDEVIAAKPTADWDEVRGDPTRLLDRAYASLMQ